MWSGAVVGRFYDELWHGWELAVADEIVSEDVRFRGAGDGVAGRGGVRGVRVGYGMRSRSGTIGWTR